MSPGFINKTEMYGGDHPGWLALEKVIHLPFEVLYGWDRAVFNVIAHRQPTCIISYERLGNEAGCKRSRAIGAVMFLEGMGFITRELNVGYSWANQFHINWDLIDAILSLTLSDSDWGRNELVSHGKRVKSTRAVATVRDAYPAPLGASDAPVSAPGTPLGASDAPEQAQTGISKQSQRNEALRIRILEKSQILKEICDIETKGKKSTEDSRRDTAVIADGGKPALGFYRKQMGAA